MKKIINLRNIVILIGLIILVSFVAQNKFAMLMPSSTQTAENNEPAIANENTGGHILGDTATPTPVQYFASQNFHSPEISVGGEAIVQSSGQQAVAPEIYDLRSELLTTKNDQAVKLAVSWKTGKPCLSSVEFMRSGEQTGKNISEGDYGYVHSAVLAPLSFSTSYSYLISAKDKWGNEVKSEKLSFYTGAPKVSIFDLLGGAFKNLFGWTGR